jgi:hypothetical protein
VTHEPEHVPQHQRCVCGDKQPCSCTPSPGWHAPPWWPTTHSDWAMVLNAITALDADLRRSQENLAGALAKKLDNVLKEIKIMSVSVDKLNADVQTLVAGYQAVVAERDALKAALAAADATQAQAVADAVAAEDADAQQKIDAADAVVDAVNNPPAPADGGDVPPADGGDTPAA